jgi:hypothetical protein
MPKDFRSPRARFTLKKVVLASGLRDDVELGINGIAWRDS